MPIFVKVLDCLIFNLFYSCYMLPQMLYLLLLLSFGVFFMHVQVGVHV